MRFRRGRDPKEALDIGISAEVKHLMYEAIEKHRYNLCNRATREEVRIQIEKKVGVPIEIGARLDKGDNNWYVDVEIIIGEIKLEEIRINSQGTVGTATPFTR